MNTNKHMKALAFAVAALGAGSANAALVTQWNVYVDSTFVPGSIVDSNGNTPGGVAISNGNKTLDWGTDIGNGQSGLDIYNSPVNTVVNTAVIPPDPLPLPVPNIGLTHTNQPIQAPSLDKVTLQNLVTLTAIAPPGVPQAPINLSFLIEFQETTNDVPGNPGTCANGSKEGVGANINGCGDIFVMGANSINQSFFYDTDGAGGDAAQQYFLSFVETTNGLQSLPTAACFAATGSNAPCLGFVTPEKANTSFNFGALITTAPVVIEPPDPDPGEVPEPGILGLVGLGLATLGGMRRRRRTA